MCASVYSSLLLFTLTISIFAGTRMVAEGLPILVRQERGTDEGILAGADFLSVFMSSSSHHQPRTTTTEVTTTVWPSDEESYTRATRSTNYLTTPTPEDGTTQSAQDINNEQSSDSSLNDGVVLAVHVSSSVGRTLINKKSGHHQNSQIIAEETTPSPSDDQNFVASEEHPSIVAEANKSEFNVEESEPITTNTNSDFLRAYPASVQPLPRFRANDFLQKKLQPIQQTVIYHNSPRERGRARSVSYSTVIQAVPHLDKEWDKHERRYEGSQQNSYLNNYEESTKTNSSKVEERPETSTRPAAPLFTTERNWEEPEKTYQRLPTVYGRPEQNYEVDESASVMTNGRVHGVQPVPTAPTKEEATKTEGKKDDSQKVGYVVEGRNYRKYRVEERTSDGFIVGEYGVVSHDDGSLRGVRYTADGTINPRLIYDALMKFLSL